MIIGAKCLENIRVANGYYFIIKKDKFKLQLRQNIFALWRDFTFKTGN